MSDQENLLLGSVSLTREEEALRNELVEWARAKLRKGHRPVPLWAAFKIMSTWTKDPDKYDLR